MEETFEVKPIGVKYICDSCNKAEMQHNDKYKLYDEYIEYEHDCAECGERMELKVKYPFIRYIQA